MTSTFKSRRKRKRIRYLALHGGIPRRPPEPGTGIIGAAAPSRSDMRLILQAVNGDWLPAEKRPAVIRYIYDQMRHTTDDRVRLSTLATVVAMIKANMRDRGTIHG